MKLHGLSGVAAGMFAFAAIGVAPCAHALATWEVDFPGTVTQAPAGNPFGVVVGDPVLGGITFFPPDPIFPINPTSIDTFTATFHIGTVTYAESYVDGTPIGCLESLVCLNTGNFLSFDGGVLIDLLVQFTPPDPIIPAMILDPAPGGQFFDIVDTNTACALPDGTAGGVCGSLVFGEAPRIISVPEPATAALLALGLVTLA